MLAMHAAMCPPAVRRKIVVGGIDQYLDTGPYNFTTPGAQAFVVDQPFAVSVETQGGQGGNGGYGAGTPGGTGGASNLDGGNVSNGGAGGPSGTTYYTGHTVTNGPVYSPYATFWAAPTWSGENHSPYNGPYWGGVYNNGSPTYWYGTDGVDRGILMSDSGGGGGGGNPEWNYQLHGQYIWQYYTAYDIPNYTWGGAGVASTPVTATVTLSAGSHTANVGAAGTPGSGAGATSNGHVKLTAI